MSEVSDRIEQLEKFIKEKGLEVPQAKKPIKMWVPYSEEWEQAAIKTAYAFAPPIRPCKKCEAPCVDGYICTYCRLPDSGSNKDYDAYDN